MTVLALGVYTAKRGTAVTARYVEAHLGKPTLIRETSRLTPLEVLRHPIKTIRQLTAAAADPMQGVVLSVSVCLIKSYCYHLHLSQNSRDVCVTLR